MILCKLPRYLEVELKASIMSFPLFMRETSSYEMDKTSISMFEILEPGGSALGKYSI